MERDRIFKVEVQDGSGYPVEEHFFNDQFVAGDFFAKRLLELKADAHKVSDEDMQESHGMDNFTWGKSLPHEESVIQKVYFGEYWHSDTENGSDGGINPMKLLLRFCKVQ